MIADNRMFGGFLIERNKITMKQLIEALKIQEKEKSQVLKGSHRLLGMILLEDFDVFEGSKELNYFLQEFKDYKEYIESKYTELTFMKEDEERHKKKS